MSSPLFSPIFHLPGLTPSKYIPILISSVPENMYVYSSFCGVLFIPRTMLLVVLEGRGNNGVGHKENASPFFRWDIASYSDIEKLLVRGNWMSQKVSVEFGGLGLSGL